MLQARPSDLDHLSWLSKAGISSFAGKKILDLGCGSGFICHKASCEGSSKAVGLDIVEPSLMDEKQKWQFIQADLNAANLADSLEERFDLILAFDILEHLDSPYNFLNSCSQLLEPKGKLILTTPNLLSWERFMHPKTWSGVKDSQHKVLFTKYSLGFLLERSGFQHIDIRAPMRALAFLGPLQAQIGGQMLVVAQH